MSTGHSPLNIKSSVIVFCLKLKVQKFDCLTKTSN